jgi:hypothetical protein
MSESTETKLKLGERASLRKMWKAYKYEPELKPILKISKPRKPKRPMMLCKGRPLWADSGEVNNDLLVQPNTNGDPLEELLLDFI